MKRVFIYNTGECILDYRVCPQCGAIMLLPMGSKECAECGSNELEWADDKAHQVVPQEVKGTLVVKKRVI